MMNELNISPIIKRLAIPTNFNHLFTQTNESSESNQIHESSLALSKSSISHENPVCKSKVNSPGAVRVQESPVDPMKTLSEMSFDSDVKENEILTGTWRMSEAITSAKDSIYEADKEKKYSIHYTNFAVPNKVYCSDCDKDVFTTVVTHVIRPGFWDSFESFFSNFACCENKGNGQEKQLLHCCSQCRRVLARISSGV